MHDFWLDVRFALRGFRREPAFAAVVIVTLALGIGFSAAIFAVLDAALLRPLGYEHEDRVVSIGSVWAGGFEHSSVSIPEYLDYRERARSLDAIAAYRQTSVNMTAGRGEPENLQAAMVTADFLDVLGVGIERGRGFTQSDDVPGAESVVLLGHGIWTRRFGADEAIVGSNIEIDGESHRVIGIMPRSMQFPPESELWTTLKIDPAAPGNRGAHNRHAIARLAPQSSLEEAQLEMSAIASALQREYPETYPEGSGWGASVLGLRELLVGDVRKPLLILMAAVAVLALIAGANVANLLLARLWKRRDEMVTRLALGARKWRLVRQVVTESLIAGIIGGAAGAWIAVLAIPMLVTISPAPVQNLGEIGVDWRVAGFTILASIAISIAFGLVSAGAIPVERSTRLLTSETRTTRASGARQLLVVAEIALAFLLMVSAGLLVRTFVNLTSTDPGLRTENVVTARIALSRDRYPDDASRLQFYDRLLRGVESRPEVERAGAISILPLGGSDTDYGFGVEGWIPPTPDFKPFEQSRIATPGYFETMRIPLVEGRTFEAGDTETSAPVVVVSRSFAEKYWPGDQAIGKRIRLWGLDADGPWWSVAGVVGDVRHFGVGTEPPPMLYFPMAQFGQRSMSVVARGAMPVAPVVIGEEARTIDPEQAVYGASTMDGVMGDSLATPRLNLTLLLMFASVAIVLAAIGIYGVMSFMVGQRMREFGIRVALGASPRRIRNSVLKRGLVLAFAGVGIGAASSAALTTVLESLLYEVSPADPVTYVIIAVAVTAIASSHACAPPAEPPASTRARRSDSERAAKSAG